MAMLSYRNRKDLAKASVPYGTRKDLAKASVMITVGEVPVFQKTKASFRPSSCTHSFYDTNIVFGGSVPVEDPDDDGEGMETDHISTANDDVLCTITDGRLLVLRDDAIMVLKNDRPYPVPTLLDVVAFNAKHYIPMTMDAGCKLVLKEGDILIVKSSDKSFHSVNCRRTMPENLKFLRDYTMYVCLPEFRDNANSALMQLGVLRDLRMRVEMFFQVWDVTWDSAMGMVAYTANAARNAEYMNQSFNDIVRCTKRVRVSGADEEEDDPVAAGGLVPPLDDPVAAGGSVPPLDGEEPAPKQAKGDDPVAAGSDGGSVPPLDGKEPASEQVKVDDPVAAGSDGGSVPPLNGEEPASEQVKVEDPTASEA